LTNLANRQTDRQTSRAIAYTSSFVGDKLTAELKSSDSVRYINKIYYFLVVFAGVATVSTHVR